MTIKVLITDMLHFAPKVVDIFGGGFPKDEKSLQKV